MAVATYLLPCIQVNSTKLLGLKPQPHIVMPAHTCKANFRLSKISTTATNRPYLIRIFMFMPNAADAAADGPR